jgi:general secretion pathway protein A
MRLQYFGFRRDPFGTSPDPQCLYLSHTHREAVASLEYGFLSNRGFTAMIALPGMGKTTLLFRCLEKFRESARTAFLFDIDPQCEPREFLGYILRDIGINPAPSSSEMHEQLTEVLIRENRAGRKFVIVIDEAQNLSDAVLERIRLLTNFETSLGKLMHIVLSGQPQLAHKLMQASLIQLRQRISTVCRLEPLSAEETFAYIDYRLKQAGYEGKPLFAKHALAMIAEASQGIPRNINNLCFNALSLCCALKSKQVDDRMVSEVIGDLQLIPQSREPIASVGDVATEQPSERKRKKQTKRLMKVWVPSTTVISVICLLGILGFSRLRAPQSATTGEAVATEPAPNIVPFEVTVKPSQTLEDIAVHYLGGFDLQRLHQIQALNPKLTDPDHIEVGQKIWLPGPPREPVAPNATSIASARKLP